MRFPILPVCLLLGLTLAPLPARAQGAPTSAPPSTAGGPGDLLVAPTRVVLDMRKRTAELNLSNIGAAAATYRISFVRMEMDEAGGISEKPFDKSQGNVDLSGLIRFSPREVILGPGDSQTVRLQVRKPPDLAAGEYRIHMVFRAVPPTPEPTKEPSSPEPPKDISIKLIPVYGLAIPVIVRHGETSAKVSLSGLSFNPATRSLRFQLDRQGNQSVYGDLKAQWTPLGRAPEVLAEATGVAVYVPNDLRRMALALATPKGGAAFGAGRLRLTYAVPTIQGGALLAEAFLDLP